jgi:adenosylmethionine-8-amino-7-oxononanoate aminotransferase
MVVSGNGARFRDETGKQYLDGASGAYVCSLGHGMEEIASAIAVQAAKIAFTPTRSFTSEPELQLASRLCALAPMPNARLWLCSSGTAANEAAVKMAYQYHVLRGKPTKTEVIARWRSYHGSSIHALSLTGELSRRAAFAPLLMDTPHVEPPYCFRCPWGKERSSCAMDCATAIETEILRLGADRVSAVITEAVSSAPLGAMPVPDGYLERVREICDRHDVLLIVDEIVTGIGRTGEWFGTPDHGATPDLMTLGKGLAAGFSPVGAILVNETVYEAFASRGASFVHYETFTGHTLSACAAHAVVSYIERHDLVARVATLGIALAAKLQALKAIPIVGDIRGVGLLWGIELVRGDGSLRPFASELRVGDRVADIALRRGLLIFAGRGAADGKLGDTLLVVPPFVSTEDDLDEMVAILADALTEMAQ